MAKANWAQAIVSAILVVGVTGAVAAPAVQPADTEKCYGISKKGMNDCGSEKHSCAGLGTVNSDPSDYLFVSKGTCKKIVGGITK